MRVLVTAGYNRSRAAIAVCELARRSGHDVAGIIIVTPFNFGRLRRLLAQGGREGLKAAFRRLFGNSPTGGADYLDTYLEEQKIEYATVREWAKKHNVPFKVVESINSATAMAFLLSKNVDLLIYAGGGILRKPIIEAARGNVINMHSGPLPEVRGMNAMEWAYLLGLPMDVTIHFIDEGIDTGDIISRVPCRIHGGMSLEELRARAVICGINELSRLLARHSSLDTFPRRANAGHSAGRQCFVMAPVLKELLSVRLRE